MRLVVFDEADFVVDAFDQLFGVDFVEGLSESPHEGVISRSVASRGTVASSLKPSDVGSGAIHPVTPFGVVVVHIDVGLGPLEVLAVSVCVFVSEFPEGVAHLVHRNVQRLRVSRLNCNRSSRSSVSL